MPEILDLQSNKLKDYLQREITHTGSHSKYSIFLTNISLSMLNKHNLKKKLIIIKKAVRILMQFHILFEGCLN